MKNSLDRDRFKMFNSNDKEEIIITDTFRGRYFLYVHLLLFAIFFQISIQFLSHSFAASTSLRDK